MECATGTVNPNANHELQVIHMCQCRPINGNKCTTLVGAGGVLMGALCMGGAGNVWGISVSSQFCCEPQTALKNSLLQTNSDLDGVAQWVE